MMPESKFVEDEELVGRTIAKVVRHSTRLILVFSDGTYTSVVRNSGYYGEIDDIEFEDVSDLDDKLTVGKISQQEYDDITARYKARSDALALTFRRIEYERLKKEFEAGK